MKKEFRYYNGNGHNGSTNGGSSRTGRLQGDQHAQRPRRRCEPSGFFVFLFTTTLAGICGAGLITILVVLYVTVRPFSQSVYRRLVAQLGAASFMDAMALLLPNTRIYLTADSDVPSPVGTSVMVMNHVMDVDWWGLQLLCRCVGLRGSLKAFLWNEYLRINMSNTSSLEQQLAISSSRRSSQAINGNVTNGNTPAGKGESKNGSPCSGSPRNGTAASSRRSSPSDLTVVAKLLNKLLEFPVISGEENLTDREMYFNLLRSFAETSAEGSSPIHLMLFPEGWSLHDGEDRLSIHAKSNEFAKREGRPQLKHLLLPRNRDFRSSIESLRESTPVVYDVTMVRVSVLHLILKNSLFSCAMCLPFSFLPSGI